MAGKQDAVNWKRLASISFYKELVGQIFSDSLVDVAAGLAFWAMLALFPFLLFIVTLSAYIPVPNLYGSTAHYLRGIVPGDAFRILDSFLRPVLTQQRPQLATLALAGALWSASSGVHSLTDALNRAYGVAEYRAWWIVRLRSLGLAILLSAGVLSAAILIIVGPPLGQGVANLLHLGDAFALAWRVLHVPVVLVLMMFVLAALYFAAPASHERWRLITPGAVVAVILWAAASWGFSIYVRHFGSYNRAYGSIGAVVVLLVWLFISSFVVLIGAEINRATSPQRVQKSSRRQAP